MQETSIREQKKALRKECRELLSSLSVEYIQDANERITALLLASAAYQRASSLFIYVSTEQEPNTQKIMEHSWAAGKAVYVPKCYGQGRMEAVRVNGWNDLAPGTLGILEPKETVQTAPSSPIDLCAIPCVSVTRDGHRLGHGAGYYDRWLNEHPKALTICPCFESLIAQNVPTDPWDISMNHVLTENGFFPPLAQQP